MLEKNQALDRRNPPPLHRPNPFIFFVTAIEGKFSVLKDLRRDKTFPPQTAKAILYYRRGGCGMVGIRPQQLASDSPVLVISVETVLRFSARNRVPESLTIGQMVVGISFSGQQKIHIFCAPTQKILGLFLFHISTVHRGKKTNTYSVRRPASITSPRWCGTSSSSRNRTLHRHRHWNSPSTDRPHRCLCFTFFVE